MQQRVRLLHDAERVILVIVRTSTAFNTSRHRSQCYEVNRYYRYYRYYRGECTTCHCYLRPTMRPM